MNDIRPLHVGISVPDMDKAVEWYIRVLGCTVKSDRYVETLKSRIVFLYLGTFQIELFQHDSCIPLAEERKIPNSDIAYCGTKHICFSVDDMDSLWKHFELCGVDRAGDIFTFNGNKVMFIRDCAGNIIEFIQEVKG